MLSSLCADKTRNLLLVKTILGLLDEGKQIIALGERRKHLEKLSMMLGRFSVSCGFYVGSRKITDEDRGAQIKMATYSFAAEGLDDRNLDCVVFVTPTNNPVFLEQCIGRAQRTERKPVVVDVRDTVLATKSRVAWLTRHKFVPSAKGFRLDELLK